MRIARDAGYDAPGAASSFRFDHCGSHGSHAPDDLSRQSWSVSYRESQKDDEDVGISSVSFGATLSKSSLRGDASERVKTPDN